MCREPFVSHRDQQVSRTIKFRPLLLLKMALKNARSATLRCYVAPRGMQCALGSPLQQSSSHCVYRVAAGQYGLRQVSALAKQRTGLCSWVRPGLCSWVRPRLVATGDLLLLLQVVLRVVRHVSPCHSRSRTTSFRVPTPHCKIQVGATASVPSSGGVFWAVCLSSAYRWRGLAGRGNGHRWRWAGCGGRAAALLPTVPAYRIAPTHARAICRS